ncbi:hypothetical protein BD310DRAFT_177891 [Dichomitus squalens]|uniref:Uncharacterized protein n=1 Tax=Dichomitus squalens TaxID=114155 RepID=A0A4Q9Q529_9APHY|nr:hypothetical protein BD310DRAFT_177891 [Dichomitus squalens]
MPHEENHSCAPQLKGSDGSHAESASLSLGSVEPSAGTGIDSKSARTAAELPLQDVQPTKLRRVASGASIISLRGCHSLKVCLVDRLVFTCHRFPGGR